MSSAGQYQGSQAFNNVNTSVKESVNPNTGSLNLSIPLVKLSGVRNSVDLSINLFYSIGFRGTFGLPRNWGLDLPYVLNAKSVTKDCQTFAIDPQWTDLKNYASGLRYTNNHGIKFKPQGTAQPLPSGQPGKYASKLENADGSADYFDGVGKPLEHHDIYGNYIRYAYTAGGEQIGVDNAQLRLQRIVDSWRQNIDFIYQPGSGMRIKLPDGSETAIQFTEAGVHTIIDAEGRKTRFESPQFGNGPLLSKISYPSGLVSKYEYDTVQYRNEQNVAGTLPAVKSVRSLDSNNNLLQHTRYTYGTQSGGQTYTGASIGCRLGGSKDALMEQAVSYKYDVTTARLDQAGKVISRSCAWYNNLHLLIETVSSLITAEGKFVDAIKTKLTYKSNLADRARTTSYNLPIATETLWNKSFGSSPDWQPMTRMEASYNEYDNTVSSAEFLHVEGAGYVKQRSVNAVYVTTPKNIQIPSQSWTYDHIAQTAELTEHKPTEDGRGIALTTTAFQRGLETSVQPQPQKEHAFNYDPQGRCSSKTLTWRAGANVLEGTVKAATTQTTFVFNGGVLSQSEIDALGNTTVYLHDMQRAGGPVVRKTLPGGQSETFDFDKLGRLRRHTDALGNQTSTIYSEAPTGTTQSVTSSLGYCTNTSNDVLGREIETSDNGDPTVPLSGQASRILTRKKYNMAGLVEESADRFGLTTKSTFDSLNRPTTVTDPQGNVISYEYQNGGSKVAQTLNGQLRNVTDLDPLSRPLRSIKYPDADDKEADYCLIEATSYNANGKALTTTQSWSPTGASDKLSPLQRVETVYGPGDIVESTTITGHTDSGADTVQRRYTLDLFDNVATYAKTTSYANGKVYSNQGPVKVYNESNQFTAYRNQEGQEERYQYDKNGWLSKTVRFDGSEVAYTVDAVGRVIKTAHSSSLTEHAFDADGHLIRTQEGSDNMTYTFSVDGTQTAMTYSDGRTQTTVLDRFSRPVKEIDVFGTSQETEYNDLGLVSRRVCQGDSISYSYGTANHTFHQYLSCSLTGGRNYTSSIIYDGFGRLRQTNVTDPTGEVLLATTYQLDARGKVMTLKSQSKVSAEHNNERAFLYDGMGQVIQDKSGSSQTTYSYDGNSNVLSTATDGKQTAMTYNKIDQRTDQGFTYDANGRLLQDNEGHTYTFDDRDRLLTVSAPSTDPTKFTYHSDSYLAQSQRGNGEADTLYYDLGGMSAVSTTSATGAPPEQRSLFSESGSLIAGYKNSVPEGYFLQQLASTALVLDSSGSSTTSATYSAYGSRKTPPQQNILSSFGFSQGYTDLSSGIVYLGARFYNPNLMAFLSMDTYQTENRYSYCEGDPINRMDPTGHDWIELLATGIGLGISIGVAAAVTAATGGLAAPVVAMLAGAAGGAAGNLASMAVNHIFGSKSYSVGDYVATGLIGALSGALTAGAKWNAGASVGKAIFNGALVGGGMAVAGAAISGRDLNGWDIVRGAAIGAASGYWGRRAYIREQTHQPALLRQMWSRDLRSAADQVRAGLRPVPGPVVNIEMRTF